MRLGMAELVLVFAMLTAALLFALCIVAVVAWLVRGGGRVACPYCRERIRAEATVCRFCGRDVTPAHPATEPDPNEPPGES